MAQGSAQSCIWPHGAGCKAKTLDPSRLCHNHRRFSARLLDNSGRLIKAPRVSQSMMLEKLAPDHFSQKLKTVVAAVSSRPILRDMNNGMAVVYPYNGTTVKWGDTVLPTPYSDGKVKIDVALVNGVKVLRIDYSASMDQSSARYEVLRRAQWATEHNYMSQHAVNHGMYNGMVEEYDDEAEALAQLNLGKIAQGTLTISDPHMNSDLHPELFKFESDYGAPGVRGILMKSFPHTTETGEVYAKYLTSEVHVDDDKSLDSSQADMLTTLAGVRTIMSAYGFKDYETGRLYLPMGWTKMPLPKFAN